MHVSIFLLFYKIYVDTKYIVNMIHIINPCETSFYSKTLTLQIVYHIIIIIYI
jgi:hypothetical protein